MTSASQRLTADDLLRMPDDGWRCELAQGELLRMPPPGYQQGQAASRIGVSLSVHVEGHDLGVVLAAETGFLLSSNPDEVRSAAVSFVSNERLATTQFQHAKYFPGAPDLLFEVLSPSDTYTAVQEKVRRWLRFGALRSNLRGLGVSRRGAGSSEMCGKMKAKSLPKWFS